MERNQPENPGKGQALDWFLRNQKAAFASCDGLVFVDADTQVSPVFLQEISDSLQHPEVRVVQGYYGVSNPDASCVRLYRTRRSASFTTSVGRARPLGGQRRPERKRHGFQAPGAERYGWPAHSVVEDLEFSPYYCFRMTCWCISIRRPACTAKWPPPEPRRTPSAGAGRGGESHCCGASSDLAPAHPAAAQFPSCGRFA